MESMRDDILDGLLAYMIFLFDEDGEILASYNGIGTGEGNGWLRLGTYEVALQWASDGYFHNAMTEPHVAAMSEAYEVMAVPFAYAPRPSDPDELAVLKSDFQVLEGYVNDITGSLDVRRPPGSKTFQLSGDWLMVDTMLQLQADVMPRFASYAGLNQISPLAQGHSGGRPFLEKLRKQQDGLCALCDHKIAKSCYLNPLYHYAD